MQINISKWIEYANKVEEDHSPHCYSQHYTYIISGLSYKFLVIFHQDMKY